MWMSWLKLVFADHLAWMMGPSGIQEWAREVSHGPVGADENSILANLTIDDFDEKVSAIRSEITTRFNKKLKFSALLVLMVIHNLCSASSILNYVEFVAIE